MGVFYELPMTKTLVGMKLHYEKKKSWFAFRRHVIHIEFITDYTDNLLDCSLSTKWREMIEFLEKHCAVAGIHGLSYTYYMYDGRIEFVRKRDAMFFKLSHLS